MNRGELQTYITNTFSTEPDYPWLKYPDNAVFRHKDSRKWFALITDVPASKLDIQNADVVSIVNLKCDPLLIGSLRQEPSFFPAWHMNKESWITIILDGTVPDDQLKTFLDMSYELTKSTLKKRKI